MRQWILTAAVLVGASQVDAQAASVIYDFPSTTPLATVQAWIPTLYVNNIAFPMTHTCVTVGPLQTCTATLPNIATALTPTGSQTFQITVKDAVLGEGAKSLPLVLARPLVATGLRIQ